MRRSDRRAVERRSWNQNPNEFRHRVADTLARRAEKKMLKAKEGRSGKAEPDRGADWPRRRAVGCAGLLVGRLAGRDRVPHPGPPPSSATTEPHHPGAVYRDGPTRAPCSRWYPISGRPRPPPDGQPRAAGAARAEQFDLQPRHINTAIDFAATPVIGAQLRPTIKRPNTRASLLPAAPS